MPMQKNVRVRAALAPQMVLTSLLPLPTLHYVLGSCSTRYFAVYGNTRPCVCPLDDGGKRDVHRKNERRGKVWGTGVGESFVFLSVVFTYSP